jgi:hypothetical protein
MQAYYDIHVKQKIYRASFLFKYPRGELAEFTEPRGADSPLLSTV